MENNKLYATVDWYDEKKGFGMARNNSIPLLVHNYYFKDEIQALKAQDIISCTPVELNNIYHATQIELVNKLDKDTEEIINMYTKK